MCNLGDVRGVGALSSFRLPGCLLPMNFLGVRVATARDATHMSQSECDASLHPTDTLRFLILVGDISGSGSR
eukprot:3735274-Rhodomonas_salina.6